MTTKTTSKPHVPPLLEGLPDELLDKLIDDGIYYPDSDDEPMAENAVQAIAMHYIFGALMQWFRDREDIYVGMDMFIYYERGVPRSVIAPDIFVVVGANGNHPRMSWMAWRENGLLPSLIIEVGSPGTHREDAGRKRDLYAKLGAREYWRFDPMGTLFTPILIGERLVDGEYEPIHVAADNSGVLRGYSELLGLDVCARADGELRFYDPLRQEWLLSMAEGEDARERSATALEQSETALEQSETARQEAEAENRRLRELLAEAGIEPPSR